MYMIKIMLCCNAGMSASLLVKKMEAAARSREEDIEIAAYPISESHDHVSDYDILLLGPQIAYTKSDFERELQGKIPVVVIPMMDYGRMNADAIIDMALNEIGK